MIARLAALAHRSSRGDDRRGWSLSSIRVLQAALWLLVASGPVAAAVLAIQLSALGHRVEVVSGQAVVSVPAQTARAEGFAELFVAAFLSAGEESAETFSPFLDASSLEGMEEGSWMAGTTVSLGADEVAPGYLAVTVAAEVLAKDLEAGQWVPVGTLFYSVGVVETDSGFATTGLPALVAPPSTVSPPELLIRRLDGLDRAPGLSEMLARFLAAYLAGDGELSRYVAPGSAIRAVEPPPFQTIEILSTGVIEQPDGFSQVAVVVRAADAAGRAQVLGYSLAVGERDGRWEVAEVLAAPLLAP